jgi:hypothetical protein
VSSRGAQAAALWYLLRRKRGAGQASVAPVPEREPRPVPEPLPAPPLEDEPESDALDLIAEETADDGAEAEHEPEAVPEPVRRHRKCGYPVGSVGCRNTCGGGS